MSLGRACAYRRSPPPPPLRVPAQLLAPSPAFIPCPAQLAHPPSTAALVYPSLPGQKFADPAAALNNGESVMLTWSSECQWPLFARSAAEPAAPAVACPC